MEQNFKESSLETDRTEPAKTHKRNPLLIAEADKTHFKCLKLPDFSIYFGEVYHVDENNNLVDILNLPEEDNSNLNPDDSDVIQDEEGNLHRKKKVYKMVRHGIGVQLFCVDED